MKKHNKLPKIKKDSFTRAEVQAVIDRLEIMIEINSYYEQTELVMGNTFGLAAGQTLLKQLLKRGSMWEGGYLDNIGVVYTDQVSDHLKSLKAGEETEQLDLEMMQRINNEA